MEVSWTEPVTGPLSNGYMIDTDVVLSSPYTITLNPVSQCQDITLVSNSSHYPIDDVVGSITLISKLISGVFISIISYNYSH